MTVEYEWSVETIEMLEGEDGPEQEIVNLDFYSKLAQVPPLEDNEVLCLVRTQGTHGYQNRSWAYVRGGQLAPAFGDAYGRIAAKVPKRFFTEFEKSDGRGITRGGWRYKGGLH